MCPVARTLGWRPNKNPQVDSGKANSSHLRSTPFIPPRLDGGSMNLNSPQRNHYIVEKHSRFPALGLAFRCLRLLARIMREPDSWSPTN